MSEPNDPKQIDGAKRPKTATSKKTTTTRKTKAKEPTIPMGQTFVDSCMKKLEEQVSGDLRFAMGEGLDKSPMLVRGDGRSEPQADGGTPTQADASPKGKTEGNVAIPGSLADSLPGEQLLDEASRARLPGEKRHEYWERMRKAARLAGLPRGQGPGTAYLWATFQADREFPPPKPIVEEELPEPDIEEAESPVEKSAAPAAISVSQPDPGVVGLSDLPPSWPELPANAQLQIEIAWVSANRLRVRSGTGVDLSKALSPAPSYSALSWLETSILFPSKFADISVKATAQQDDEREGIRREKLAIEEIRGILKEMMDAAKSP